MDSFLMDLKKDVQCSLCNDTFIEPKILQCFHTFCKLCIKRHSELIEDQAKVFKCPKCLSETSLPELSSVDDLKPSILHSRILKGLALVESEKACFVSESHSPASWYCFGCNRSMCDDCVKSHSVYIKDHKVVCLADLKREDIELIIKRENNCKIHPNQRLELFCEDCDAIICLTCLKHHHEGHKPMSLDAFASIKKDVLSKHLELLEHLRLDDKEKQEQEEIASILEQDGERAKREVKDKTKKIIDILQQNERELLRQIDDKLDIAKRNLNIIHHIPAAKEHINNVMERGLASDLINIQEKECSETFIFNPIPKYSIILFVANEELMQHVNSASLGVIHCFKSDHTMSTIQVESEQEALRKAKLIVIPKTSTEELNKYPSDVVDVKISPEDNVKVGKKYVTDAGKIEIEFMAKVPGNLTAEVKVNGNHVYNSPLVMNVKPQKMRITRFDYLRGMNKGSPDFTEITVNKQNSKIAVADEYSPFVHVLNTDGALLLTYSNKGSGQAGQLQSWNPVGLAFLNETDLVIADYYNHRICIMNTTTGTLVKTFGSRGNGNGEFSYPRGVHVDDDGNIFVSDNNHRVQVFTKDGDYQYQFGLTEKEKFVPVYAVTHGGLFYVSDSRNNVIHVFEKKGNVPTRISTISGDGTADGQLSTPLGLAIDNDHNLLVCDNGNKRIQKFTLDGRSVESSCDEIKNPYNIAVLNDGRLLVTSYGSGVFFVE